MNKSTFQAMAAQYATQKTAGEGIVSWEDGAHCVIPEVTIYGKAVQDGTPTPENPIEPVFSSGMRLKSTNDAGFDGGEAVAPELLAIPGTKYRDEWDAQTGRGVHNIRRLELTGTESWNPNYYPLMILQFWTINDYILPYSYGLCNCGGVVRYGNIVGTTIGFEDAFSHYGVDSAADWMAYLAERYAAGDPVVIWYQLKTPIPFQTDPQPLVQPKGTCHLIQTDGTLDDCPIAAKYVTHS